MLFHCIESFALLLEIISRAFFPVHECFGIPFRHKLVEDPGERFGMAQQKAPVIPERVVEVIYNRFELILGKVDKHVATEDDIQVVH